MVKAKTTVVEPHTWHGTIAGFNAQAYGIPTIQDIGESLATVADSGRRDDLLFIDVGQMISGSHYRSFWLALVETHGGNFLSAQHLVGVSGHSGRVLCIIFRKSSIFSPTFSWHTCEAVQLLLVPGRPLHN